MTERYYVTDSDLSEQYTLYTRANVGEVFPDPVTPLTSSTGLYQAELGWRDAWERMGAFTHEEFPQDTFAQLGVVGGYCYLNASLIRLFGVRAQDCHGKIWMNNSLERCLECLLINNAMEMKISRKTRKIGETFNGPSATQN